MKDVFKNWLDNSVQKWFGQLAGTLGLQVEKVTDGVFEIRSDDFWLRISGSRNHGSDLVDLAITLFSNQRKRGIGLANIMEFYGDRLISTELVATPASVDREIERLAQLASKYCKPFLRGVSTDWRKITEFVERKIVDESVRERKYDLPKFVREEWEVEPNED